MNSRSPYLEMLKNWIDLVSKPFTERGSRLLVFRDNGSLYIRLAERWFKRTGELAAYRKRPPLIERWIFTDAVGNKLDYSLTSYPDYLEFHTGIGVFRMVFVDTETILVTFPDIDCGVSFFANLDQGSVDRRGGVFHLTGDIRRNMAYTTNARILANEIRSTGQETFSIRLQLSPGKGDGLLLNVTPRLGFNRYMPQVEQVFDAAEKAWGSWFDAAPPVDERYRAHYYFAWWVMRAGLISTRYFTTREAMTPSKLYYVGVWQWDAYFHALAYRHIDSRLAEDQIRILLDHQREDGMIPDAVHDEGVVTHLESPVEADVTKPPLTAWAAWKIYEKNRDVEFLKEIYEPLVRWNNWWYEKNDIDRDGLCEYAHPYSSGLDDSPLWDGGMPVNSPDLNTYLCIAQDSLAKIAKAIGLEGEALAWRTRADSTAGNMLEKLYDEKASVFWSKKDGRIIDVLTPFNLFPFLTGRLDLEITNRLVSRLTDPRVFWPEYPVPTVAMTEKKYEPDQMWRGPAWANINYLLIEGLQKTGFHDEARELRTKTLEMICGHDNMFEYYNPTSGANPPKAAPIFGWTSAVFIDLAIQAAEDNI